MFTGQVAVISNRATWTSDVYQLIDEDNDDAVIDITDPTIGFSATVSIYDRNRCPVVSGSTADGKLTVTGTGDDIGLQWQFARADLCAICAGTYHCGVKITVNGEEDDLIIGTVTVVEGNP